MTFATGRYRAALYALFALSGVAGLIYESIWSHYLKLFLGHAAYAQTLVLCIFMGGMAIGAGLAARWISRLRRPLLVYVAVEATLGAVALIFDPMFRGMQAWVFDSLLPQLETEWLVDLCKWGLGTALILPQSILLGTTFPLMSSAVVRLDAALAGRTLGWLYFTNSLGAAIGVLLSGFVLIDLVGLPGTIFTGGLINFVLAASVYLLARADRFWAATGDIPQALQSVYQGKGHLMLLWVAALTGLASFIYEIAWIRMLSLVIGAATHSFELFHPPPH
jgi:spermidine synthase